MDIPLVLMNSLHSDEDTRKSLEKYKNKRVTIHTFVQSSYPLMYKDTLAPISDAKGKER